ncbi:hypothetical protein EMIHUDRAFT_469494 [Emiliania huxleyi CCMP1516]|uniref:Uncharacterized protein n=2 Tax=Emiliania huxleyi TaxID=2903 RepID=A0A0D3JJ82_EMIH1|nr:hypothetical protein EMIHUDRAFT_469494 [Emiliania huxleyi CCMP1516]EOD23567.1 hypothetical protein EMIHUDRAFT_469494 [Emiliania huxleyi CCMP1516]|eukprot:XP_005775996.1 hypothetical protein EMIHUDRAFT_469494 [Emiliania huxleyi CCMP1516]
MVGALLSRRRVAQGLLALSRLASSAAASPTAPLSGCLYRYKHPSWPAPLQAFESPAAHAHRKYCVYIGGLTDGLLACSYVEALGAALDERGWSLVQPVLSSSYAGFGCSSLQRDADELAPLRHTHTHTHTHTTAAAQLLRHIADREEGDAEFALVGATPLSAGSHSTGCQDAVTLLRTAPPELRCRVRAAVLQAPVSDRESQTVEQDSDGSRGRLLAEAEAKLAAGEGEALLSQKYYGFVPISASRFASLVGRDGPDDLFSSDFTDEQLAAKLGHMGLAGQRATAPSHPGLRTLFCFSGGDEYVPPSVDVPLLARRFVAAAGGAENGASALILAGASHNLAKPPRAAGEFVAAVCRTLDEI